MTYFVSSGTLNSTIPYHTIPYHLFPVPPKKSDLLLRVVFICDSFICDCLKCVLCYKHGTKKCLNMYQSLDRDTQGRF